MSGTATWVVGTEHRSRRTVRASDIDGFAALSGDTNELHLNSAYARQFGFRGRVAHGMLTGAFLSSVLGVEFPGRGVLWLSQTLHFLGPVFEGDEIEFVLRVARISEGTGVCVLEVDVRKTTGEPVLKGEAKIMSLENQNRPSFKDTVAVVTGASRGIGAAIALALARRGVKVVIGYRGNEAAAQKVRAEIEAAGGTALAVAADITTEEGVKHLATASLEAFGTVHVLVNNASPHIGNMPLLEMNWDQFTPFIEAFVKAPFLLAREFMPHMIRQRHGRVINILTSALLGAPPHGMGAYAAAKAALASLSRSLSLEAAGQGVTVNNVLPSAVMTDQWADLSDARRRAMAMRNPSRRTAVAEDVANAVLFLAAPESDFVNGVSIPVTGGESF